LGLVGESGCGKSTLGRCLLRLYDLDQGEISYKGKHLEELSFSQMRPYRREMQMIFQDPYSALNPRMTIFQSVRAPLDAFRCGSKAERKERVEEMLRYVGLSQDQIYKYPHEMSGGQRQRAVIARAMVLEPAFVVCDEPVSALDASVRAQVLNLMKNIQRDKKPAYLFISHDLSVVRFLCDRVAVMYLGKIVEYGTRDEVFQHPAHPYTKALMSAIPVPDVDVETHRIVLRGDVPSPMAPPSGCRFHTRCPMATAECAQQAPELTDLGGGHLAACLRAAH
jgi:oligopeptide/dipeptide ABC transporter ATP-binding protein